MRSHIAQMKLYQNFSNLVRSRAGRSPILMDMLLLASHRSGYLRGLEAKTHALDTATLKRCREYSTDVFGKEIYALQLVQYCAIHGSWRDGWIPETYFRNEVISRSTPVPHLSREKTLSAYFVDDGALPDVAYSCNGHFFADDRSVVSLRELPDLLFDGRHRIVFKTNSSRAGGGVFFFSREDFDAERIRTLGDGCFQSYIQPDPAVPTFDVPSVPTLRLVTTIGRTGSPTGRYCYLRVARIGDTHVNGHDAVRACVCMETGNLRSYGYLSDWTRVSAHPDTGIPFEGLVHPRIGDALEACIRLHRKMPSFLSIGWDLCLSDCGAYKVMEWNQLHGIRFAEAVYGPNFTDLGWEHMWRQSA